MNNREEVYITFCKSHMGDWSARDLFYGGYDAALASQAQQSQWISVEERLPEDCDLVLCHHISTLPDLPKIATIKANRLNPAKKGFYVEYDKYGSEEIEKVTHWMPLSLPPAPEGE